MEAKTGPTREKPDPDEIRATLNRITGSDVFRGSPQLASFLRFIVEAVLSGKEQRIKGYVIAVEVLRRDVNFDPQIDPIVRVEASRLRRTIERYYAGPGLDDELILDLPRGSYVPTFRWREPLPLAANVGSIPGEKIWNRNAFGRWPLVVASVACLIVFATAAIILPNMTGKTTVTGSIAVADLPGRTDASPLRPGNGMPNLAVQPFDTRGVPGPQGIIAESLRNTLSDAFSRFDLVNILSEPTKIANAGPRGEPEQTLEPTGDFRLSGSIEYSDAGSARIYFRLIDTIDSTVVWSRVFENVSAGGDRNATQDAIVRELTRTLVQPFGVIYSYERAKKAGSRAGDARYDCVLDTVESFRSFDGSQITNTQTCLERLTSADPSFAIGFTYLASSYLREYLYGKDKHENGLPPLERALRAALRGVELKPESSRAYEMLFSVLFARGELPEAFAAGDKAIKLNKYDMRTVGAYGSRLIASGNIDRGMTLLQQAEEDGTVVPAFEQFHLFLGNYLKGDLTRAWFHAGRLTSDTFQLGLIARALVASANNDHTATRGALNKLITLNPAWHDNPQQSLEKFFKSASISEHIRHDLVAAGLTDPVSRRPLEKRE